MGTVKKEELDNNISLKNLFEGLEMTRTVLQKTFVKHGLKQISPEGEKFDPTLHEAVFQIPKDKVSHFFTSTKVYFIIFRGTFFLCC